MFQSDAGIYDRIPWGRRCLGAPTELRAWGLFFKKMKGVPRYALLAAALPSQTAQTQTSTEAGVVSFISAIFTEVAKLVAKIG